MNDSNSIVALSVSISAKISPSLTESPTFFNQVATVPVDIVSLKRGIVITFTPAGISALFGDSSDFDAVAVASFSVSFSAVFLFNSAEISSPAVPTIANKESTGADPPSSIPMCNKTPS